MTLVGVFFTAGIYTMHPNMQSLHLFAADLPVPSSIYPSAYMSTCLFACISLCVLVITTQIVTTQIRIR